MEHLSSLNPPLKTEGLIRQLIFNRKIIKGSLMEYSFTMTMKIKLWNSDIILGQRYLPDSFAL